MFPAPSGSPTFLQIITLSSTSIQVAWQEIPISDRNGVIIVYEALFEWYASFPFRQLGNGTVNVTGLSLELMDLQPFTFYSISVRAYTSVGHGPFSRFTLARTLEDGKIVVKHLSLVVY